MQTQCPQCETRFRITDAQLKAAKGHVRCGLCDEVFNASLDQDIKLPEIISNIVQTPDNEQHDKEFQQQETTEQIVTLEPEIKKPETKIDTSLDDSLDTSTNDAQSSDNNNVVNIDVTQQQNESAQNNDDYSNKDTFDTDNPNEHENLAGDNDEFSDDHDDEAIQDKERKEEQIEAKIFHEKNFDVDTIDLNDLDIDNSAQDNSADDEIYLNEDNENSSASDTIDDDINIEISNDDELLEDEQQEKALDFFDEDNNQDSPQIIPDELREQAATNDAFIGKNIAWVGGILLLSFTLGLQYFWLNRNQFVQLPDTRALIEKTCLTFNCSKLTLRDPSNIELLTRNVYSHPNEKNALMINIVLQNNAKFSQPYPVLQINFSDIRGDDVVARRFTPAEYLKIDQKNHPLLQPGTSANFNLEIEDPGKQAITYEFNFL